MRTRQFLLSTAAVLPAILSCAPALAQSTTLAPPPIRQPLDENGVDLSSGDIVVPSSSVTIGGSDGLTHSRYRVSGGWRHNYLISAVIKQGQSAASVNIGGSRRTFTLSGGVYVSDQGTGERITPDFATGTHIYVGQDGTQIILKESYVGQYQDYYGPVDALGEEIIAPSGVRTKLHYLNDEYQGQFQQYTYPVYVVRLQSVTSNTGYQLHFDYQTDSAGSPDAWYEISRVTAINNATEYCDPMASACSLTQVWPYLQYAKSSSGSDTLETVTDVLGRQTRFRTDASDRLTGVKRPSQSSDDYVVSWGADQRVSAVTRQGAQQQTYSWSPSSGILTATSVNALGAQRVTTADSGKGLLLTSTNPLGNQTQWTYDSQDRLASVIAPADNRVEYTRDARGRVTQVRQKAKPGSGLADIVTSASYPALSGNQVCANAVTCDSPVTSTDARGKVTNYTYDQSHGGLLKAELPADGSGQRPTTFIYYGPMHARYMVSPGTLAHSPLALMKPTQIRTCRTGASCFDTANEQIVEIGYDSNIAENLQPVIVRRRAGDGTLVADSWFTYSKLGDVETVDGPLPGSGDTAVRRYDNAGQLVGAIGPSPDGDGNPRHAASRLTYNADGQVTFSESGTVAAATEAGWNGFIPLTRSETQYDAFGRVAVQRQVAVLGTAQFSAVQNSYDAIGRPDCTALRMNAPSTSSALPASACTPMAAVSGEQDRIGKRSYDAANRVVESRSGVGTPLEQITAKVNYTANGQTDWVIDAEGNRTNYTLDGFDRSERITYPSKTTPGFVDPNDYEAVTYDAAGNILTHRTRAGETFGYTYDNLGRVTLKDVPTRAGLAATHTRDVHYGYDLLGALTYARFDSPNGEGLSFAYDALGRLTAATTALDGASRTLAYQYDTADRQTRITHPDGQWFGYEYYLDGAPSAITDNTGYKLVDWLRDGHGRVTTQRHDYLAPDVTFGYDGAERLSSITLDHPSASYDVTRTASFNPANQAASETLSNNAFAWSGHPSPPAQVDYTVNGLNQYTQANANSYGYEANGNLGNDGANSYAYDPENRLVAVWGQNNATMRYDPFGRLYEITDGNGNIRRWLYDRDALVGEYNPSGTMLDRYVHGVGAGDDPLIRFAGSSTVRANAEHLYTDRRGSVTFAARYDGTATQINSYDEYGVPGPETGIYNNGRFRYTGQAWLPNAGIYYYKARMYSPTIGRFLQTDPIGYADGMNLYAYVRNDPVNGVDPSGLSVIFGTVCEDDDEGCIIVVTADKLDECEGFCLEPDDPLVQEILGELGIEPGIFAVNNGIVVRGRGKQKKKKSPQSGEEEGDLKDCLTSFGEGFVDGALNPENAALALGVSAWHAANRTAPQDHRPLTNDERAQPRNQGTLRRSFGSALRIGAKRVIPGYLAISAAVGVVKGVANVVTDPSCKIK